MNLLEVSIGTDGTVAAGGTRLAIPVDSVPAYARGRRLIMGVRPENLIVNAPGLPMKVEMVETLGSDQLVHGLCGGAPMVVRCATRVAAQGPVAVGDEVDIGPDSRHPLHWFDADTGRRVSGDHDRKP